MSTVISAVGEATGLKPTDEVIAQGLMALGKVKIMTYCTALVESFTPEVRQILGSHLQEALAAHQRMTDLAVKRGWYKADASPHELLQQAVAQAQPLLQ